MRFLKTLQKRETERPHENEVLDGLADREVRSDAEQNEPPGLLSQTDFRIGAPTTALKNGADKFVKSEVARSRVTRSGIVDKAEFGDRSEQLDSIPKISVNVESVNRRVVSITQPRSAYCEEYRSLRTQILYKSQKRRLQTIVVVSVGPSEGKTVTALNLSWLFAKLTACVR